jgi:hypothetical protein
MTTISRFTLLAGLSGLTALAAGCSDPADPECEGDDCPCADITDCPDPFTQFCGPEFTCVQREEADADVGGDPVEDALDVGDVLDTGGDVGPDTPDGTPGDTIDDALDAADAADTGDVEPEVDVEDTGTDPTTDVEIGNDTDAEVEVGAPDVDVPDVDEPPPALANPWLAFTAPGADFLTKVWMVRSNGRDLTQIDTGDLLQFDPSFSPDGTVLAFRTIGGTTGPVVKTVDLTTGVVTEILHGLSSLASLDWSPDGTELICEGRDVASGNNDLFRIPLDGSGAVRVGETDQPEAAPVWLDDNTVYFISDQDTTVFDLWKRDLTTLEWCRAQLERDRLGLRAAYGPRLRPTLPPKPRTLHVDRRWQCCRERALVLPRRPVLWLHRSCCRRES